MIDLPNLEEIIRTKKIKNISKYSVINNEILNNPDKFIELSKKININPETLSSYLKWFQIDNTLYFFKSYNCFEELFMENIFNKMDIPTVPHTIVRLDNKIGIISPNFRKPGNKYKDYDEIVKQSNLKQSLKYLSTKMTKTDFTNYKEQLFKIIATDIIFGQSDHFSYNINFEISQDSIKLAPLFDNGELFSNQSSHSVYFSSCFENLEFYTEDTYPNEHTLTVLFENPELARELSYTIDYDLNSIFDELENQYKIIIYKKIRKEIQKYYDQNCTIIEKTLNLIR